MRQINNEYIAIPAFLKVESNALSKMGTYLKEMVMIFEKLSSISETD